MREGNVGYEAISKLSVQDVSRIEERCMVAEAQWHEGGQVGRGRATKGGQCQNEGTSESVTSNTHEGNLLERQWED